MNRDTDYVIKKSYTFAQRKDVPPPVGSKKYNVLLELADSFQKEWAAEPDIEWNSLYGNVNIGDADGNITYPLDDSIRYITKVEENPITVGGKPFQLVEIGQLNRYTNGVAQVGRVLQFNTAPATGAILVPSMTFTTDITDGANIVQVDDPMWLAWMMGSEFIRNDLVRQNQYANMLNHAQLLMEKMKQANMGQVSQLTLDFPVMGANFS